MNPSLRNILSSKYVKWYLAFVAIVCISAAASFVVVYNVVFTNTVNSTYSSLVTSVKNMDSRLMAVTNAVLTLQGYPETVKLMTKHDVRTEDFVNFSRYRNLLNVFFPDNDFMLNYYFYFPKSGLLFDKKRVYLSVHDLYGAFAKVEDWSARDFVSQVLIKRFRFQKELLLTWDGASRKVLPFSPGNLANGYCSFVAMVDVFSAGIGLGEFRSKTGYALRIRNDDGVLVDSDSWRELGKSKTVTYDPTSPWRYFGDNILLTAKSESYGLTVELLLSRGAIFSVMSEVIMGYALIFGVMALLLSLVVIIVESRFSRGYTRIANAYNNQRPVVKNYYASRLLETFAIDEEILDCVGFFQIDENKRTMTGIVVNRSEEAVRGELRQLLEALPLAAGDRCSIVSKWLNPRRAALIVYNFENPEEIRSFISSGLGAFNREHDASFSIGFGKCYQGARGVSVSFEEAKKVVSYQGEKGGFGVLSFEDLPDSSEAVVLDVEEKNRIQLLIASGEGDKAIELFVNIFNKKCRNTFILNPVGANNFVAQAASVLIQSLRDMVHDQEERRDLQKEIAELFLSATPDEFIAAYSQVVGRIASQVEGKDSRHKQIQRIIEYINENYHDHNLSLTLLGDVFHMNESYISHYFRLNTGGKFSQYLERLRMEHAAKLIEQDSRSINQIVTLVGYSNRNTFYKAFIRMYGVSPKVYKEQVMTKSITAGC